MALPDSVGTFIGRLETFQTAHPLAKRRASSTKKKTPTTATWPYETPTPEELAMAGFFYKPQPNNLDNIQCFICQRQLDGWEPGDNPAYEHLTHSPDCGWAINICIRLREGDPNRVEDDPMSEHMMESRRVTFQDKWPHEHKKGWKPKISKMVEAGWVLDPSPEWDDGVTCNYCSLSLDGWEPKDDPLHEHRKRSPNCYFFQLCEEYAESRKPARGKKGRAARTSKASRASLQSTFSEAPSLMSLGSDMPAEAEDSVLTTATTATGMSTASKTSKVRKAKGKATTKATKKGARAKKTAEASELMAVDDSVAIADSENHYPEVELQDESPKAPQKRTTRRTSKLGGSSMLEASSVLEPVSPPRKAVRTKTAKAKNNAQAAGDESHLYPELPEPSLEISKISNKPKRGTKRTSDGMPKDEASTVTVDTHEEPAPKPKRGRKAKKAAEPAPPEPSEVVQEPEEVPETKPKASTKSKNGKKNTKKVVEEPKEEAEVQEEPEDIPDVEYVEEFQPVPEPQPVLEQEPEPEFEQEPEPEPELEPALTEENAPPSEAEQGAGEDAEEEEEPENDAGPESDEDLGYDDEAAFDDFPIPPSSIRRGTMTPPAASSPASEPKVAEPTPSQVQIYTEPSPDRQDRHTVTSPAKPTKAPAKSPSPQSSDAENRPPPAAFQRSVNPASAQLARTPTTVRTPIASPSKQLLSGLSTSVPWEPIDLEAVFLGSLRKPPALFDSHVSNELFEKEGMPLDQMIERVKEGLTSPEKRMTVEEWVLYNADRGEEALRAECERQVAAFETMGNRAIASLEGLECS